MSPSLTLDVPLIMLMSVVFPAPLGPMRPRISRSCSSKFTAETATRPAKRLVSRRTARIGAICSHPMRADVLGEVAPAELPEAAADIGQAARHENDGNDDDNAEEKRGQGGDFGRQQFGDAG